MLGQIFVNVAIPKLYNFISLPILFFNFSNVAIFTMRYYVFRSAENLKQEYIKAWGVYLSTMLLNYAAMFVMVDILNINQLGAQAFYTLFSVVFTYIMHKYFSFCRKNQPAK